MNDRIRDARKLYDMEQARLYENYQGCLRAALEAHNAGDTDGRDVWTRLARHYRRAWKTWGTYLPDEDGPLTLATDEGEDEDLPWL